MAWPTQQNENNVDSAGASLSDARTQVYQNLSNINDIIDTFGITNPQEGQILRYNSTTSKFENVAQGTIVQSKQAIVKMTSTGGGPSDFEVIFDDYNIITLASDSRSFSFNDDGNYFLEYSGHMILEGETQPDAFLDIQATKIKSDGNFYKHIGPKFQILERNYVTGNYFDEQDGNLNYVSVIDSQLPEYPFSRSSGGVVSTVYGGTFYIRIYEQ